MAKKLELRSVMPDEERELRKLAASRTLSARLVQRAKILVTMLDEPEIGAMEAGRRAGLSGQTGCAWVKRFNEGGLDVLEDEPRGGRPPTHPPEVRSALVNLATQKPRSLGLPFELWTLERLQREFQARGGVHGPTCGVSSDLHRRARSAFGQDVPRRAVRARSEAGHL